MQLSKDIIERIVLDPEFSVVLDYIESHFENSMDIQTIDVTKDSTVVHAEVIARQAIDDSIKSLRNSFKLAKDKHTKSKITYE